MLSPNFETVGVALQLLFFDEIQNTVHNYAAARLVGGHFQSAGLEMQMGKGSICARAVPRDHIANSSMSTITSMSRRIWQKLSVKICGICG